MSKAQIVAIGANPAWQKVLQFEDLRHDQVNRAVGLWSFASGKGINFARASHNWGSADVELLQFAGGENGKLLLDDLKREKLSVTTIDGKVPTRCCITCLSNSDNSMTELIEPSPAPAAEAQAQALQLVRKLAKTADGMALCGQLPAGMSSDFYVECVKAAGDKPVLIDSWKNINSVLSAAQNALLKINRDELTLLTGIDDLTAAIKSLFADYALKYIAITDGAHAAYLASKQNAMWRFSVPRIEQVVNPVGSGDTASAVLLSSLLSGAAPEQAFAWALAAASENCLSMKCAEFDRSKALELCKDIKIETL